MTAGEIYSKIVLPAMEGAAWHPWGAFLVAINEAQTILAAATGALYQVDTIVLAPGERVVRALPVMPLFRRLKRCSTVSHKLAIVSPIQMISRGLLETGSPRRVAQIGASLLLFDPAPSEMVSLEIEYERFPRAINSEQDVPEVPLAYHRTLGEYAVARMKMMDGGQEFARVAGKIRSFLAEAERLAEEVKKRGR
jgi:hypothetical protein